MKDEQGLSEVIGFLMIVSLLAILFSMYLLYVVPIQGRDAEISHMKYITQEFIGLKADIDGLIINDKINMPIARSFELGTMSSVGKGSLSIVPMSSFIEAAGTLMVNEQNDYLTVTVVGDFVDYSGIEGDIETIKDGLDPLNYNFNERGLEKIRDFLLNKATIQIYYQFNPADPLSANPQYAGKLDINSPVVDPPSYYGIPFYFGDRFYILKPVNRMELVSLTENENYRRADAEAGGYDIPQYRIQDWDDRYDIILEGYSIIDNAAFELFLDGLDPDYNLAEYFEDQIRPPELIPHVDFNNPLYKITIVSDVTDSTYYTINIFNNNEIIPESLEDYVSMHPNWLNDVRNTLIQLEYSKIEPLFGAGVIPSRKITTHLDDTFIGGDGALVNPDNLPPQIGSLQYWSQNRYWVNQDLLYEMGGLFLKQSDGVSIMLVPSIAATPIISNFDPAAPDYDLKVSFTNIRITDTEDVSGSLSAQVFSKVDSIANNVLFASELLYDPATPLLHDLPGGATGPTNYYKIKEGEPNTQFIWIKFSPENPNDYATTLLWKRGFDQIKTIASKSMTGFIGGDYTQWIHIITVNDDPNYSANLIIADGFGPYSCGNECTDVDLDDSIERYFIDIENDVIDPDKFIFDYKEAEISLVMQSGAL